MSRRTYEELFEPRRLRDSTAAPDAAEGRLSRQLRSLSAYAPMRQLRRYSAVPRGRRYAIALARLIVVAVGILAVSSVAAAMAGYVVRQVRSAPRAAGQAEPPAIMPRSAGSPRAARRAPAELTVPTPVPQVQVVAAPPSPPRLGSPRPPLPPVEAMVAPMPAAAASDKSQPPGAKHAASAGASRVPPARHPEQALPEPPASVTPDPVPSTSGAGGSMIEPSARAHTSEPTWPAPPPADEASASTAARGSDGQASAADTVTQEAALLRQALAALRRDHDARAALRLLDEYGRRFGHGVLALEAASTRAQALLQLGDNAGALELLDRLPLTQGERAGELRVTRGELRAVSGRCREAILDFDAVLGASLGKSRGTAASALARALFGRASCRARLGDSAGAEADRQRYLKEHPEGPAAGRLLPRP